MPLLPALTGYARSARRTAPRLAWVAHHARCRSPRPSVLNRTRLTNGEANAVTTDEREIVASRKWRRKKTGRRSLSRSPPRTVEFSNPTPLQHQALHTRQSLNITAVTVKCSSSLFYFRRSFVTETTRSGTNCAGAGLRVRRTTRSLWRGHNGIFSGSHRGGGVHDLRGAETHRDTREDPPQSPRLSAQKKKGAAGFAGAPFLFPTAY